jgi:hypothetical protein
MKRLPQSGAIFGMVCLALGLSLSQGCDRSDPRSATGSPASEQKLPFHSETDQASSEGVHPAVAPDPKVANSLPFGPAARTLPSGTLVTVQLENTLSTAKVRAGDAFAASVAAPLAIDGDRLVERGTAATGHIESVRSRAGAGYFQLTLNAITVEGKPVLLQTSSLYARATAQQPDGVRVQKGRRLTFRLTSPVTLGEPKSTASHQPLGPTSE